MPASGRVETEVGKLLGLPSGRSIYCSEKGAGPSVLCLHGLGGGDYFFAGLADALQDAYRTVAVDLPGCGFSPPNASGFSFDDCADVVEELIQQQLGERPAILGHSMGTIVALKLAARLRVSGLIFVGGLPQPIPEAQQRLRQRAREIRKRGIAGIGDLTIPIVFSEASRRAIPDKVAMYHRLLELNDPEKYAQASQALSEAKEWELASTVSVPCLAITGSEDRYAPPAAVKEFVSRLPGPVEYCEIEECGHMPFFEKPNVFESLVLRFLDIVTPPGS